MSETRTPTPYAVLCEEHGQVFLTSEEYHNQLRDSDSYWYCPICKNDAYWDDENSQNQVLVKRKLTVEEIIEAFEAWGRKKDDDTHLAKMIELFEDLYPCKMIEDALEIDPNIVYTVVFTAFLAGYEAGVGGPVEVTAE